jgi:hypothetical protein
MAQVFEDMTPEELNETIDSLKFQLQAYRLRYRDGMHPDDDDRDWYTRASAALARARYVRNPLEDSRLKADNLRLTEALAEMTEKHRKIAERLSLVLSGNAVAEINAAFIKVARHDLPFPTYVAIKRKATVIAKEAEAAAPTTVFSC